MNTTLVIIIFVNVFYFCGIANYVFEQVKKIYIYLSLFIIISSSLLLLYHIITTPMCYPMYYCVVSLRKLQISKLQTLFSYVI